MRRFYITFVLAFLSSLVCTRALAYDFEVNGIYYTITSSEDLTVEVKSGTVEYSGDVFIPATVENDGKNYRVTCIGEGAFYNCFKLSNVTLPEGLNTIAERAFYQCNRLEKIILPNGLTSIGNQAFAQCYKLKEINLPESLTDISVSAFESCSSFPTENGIRYVDYILVSVEDRTQTSYEIKDGVTIIGSRAFADCQNLTSITIPASVKQIAPNSFIDCVALTDVVFQDGAAFVGGFQRCTSLTSVNMPNSVKVIGERAFEDCTSLKNISIGTGVECICTAAFYNCSSLKSIVIPDNVKIIGRAAFSNCTGVNSLTLGAGVDSIDSNPFYGCKGILYLNNSNDFNDFDHSWGVFYGANFDKVVIGDNVTKVGDGILKRIESLKEIVWGANVESIGNEAFYACTGLDILEIPSSVSSLEGGAFLGCSNLTSVTMSGIKTIGNGAFNNCENLKSVIMGKDVTDIQMFAFLNCTSLTNIYLGTVVPPIIDISYTFYELDKSQLTIYVPDGFVDRYRSNYYWKDFPNIAVNPYVTVEKKAVIYMVDGEEYHRDSVAVTATITLIDEPTKSGYKFSGWSGYPEDLIMPDNDVIVSGTFTENIAPLTDFEFADENKTIISKYIGAGGDVVIPADKGIVAIGDGAFKDCTALTSVVIPDGVATIGREAFSGCSNLTKAAIPNSVESIAPYAFYRTALENLEIPEGLQSIENSTFGYIKTKSITIPSSVKIIKNNAFCYCSSLEEITFNEGLETISSYAFQGSSLVSISLPASLKSVSGYAFAHCNKLSSIKVAEGNETYDSRDNCNAVIQKSNNELVVGCKATVVPNSVTAICAGAFYLISSVTEINLPEGLTRIDATAFSQCRITKITIPSSLTSVAARAFEWCPLESITVADGNTMYDSRNDCNAVIETATNTLVLGGTTTVIPNEVEVIGDYAFYGRNTEGISLPEGVTTIGQYALAYNNMQSFVLPNSVTTLGAGAFYCCGSLSSIIIPEGVKIIDSFTFGNCESLVTIDIPNSVTNIGGSAFYYCSNLKSVTLGYRVQELADYAFSSCPAVETLNANSPVPPTCTSSSLSNLNKETCVLYVPEGSLDAYKEADIWKEFVHIEVNPNAPTPYYDVTYVVDGEVVKTDVVAYGETITLLEDPTKEGLCFSGWSGYPEDMIMPAHDITVTGTFSTTSLAIINTSHASDKKTYDMFGREVKTMQGGQLYLRGGKKLLVRP